MTEYNEKVIPLVVKKGQNGQKFRIPFKNNGPQDLDIDFTFVKQSAVIQGPNTGKNSPAEDSKALTQSPIEFGAMPNNLKVAANSTAILNIVAKLKNSYQLANIGRENAAQSSG